MKKESGLVLTLMIFATMALTGCSTDYVLDESAKAFLTEAINEKKFEIINISGMAYFCIDADYVQLCDIDGNPISYEIGKSHTLLTRDLDFSDDNSGYTYIVEDSETNVKYLHSARMEGFKSIFNFIALYESDTDLILGENGLPKID